jgi:hypothetical protein
MELKNHLIFIILYLAMKFVANAKKCVDINFNDVAGSTHAGPAATERASRAQNAVTAVAGRQSCGER